MNSFINRIGCFIAFLAPFCASSQDYPLGPNPGNLKWKQIKTDKAWIVFPDSAEAAGQRVANMLGLLYDKTKTIGGKKTHARIILQNQTAISNGFVTVSPFRSEFFTTPPQLNFAGSANWIDLLGIHEYRHLQQYTNAKRGLTKIASLLFGQNGWGGASGAVVPRWFWEGDAVVYETSLSPSGRGRYPGFEKDYRALLMSGISYSYEKASAGSYKHFVPNHYNLGYYMVNYGRKTYGEGLWAKALADAASYKGFYPMSRSLRKQTGAGTRKTFKAVMADLKQSWDQAESKLPEPPVSELVSPAKGKLYTDYSLPFFAGDSLLVFEKKSFQEISALYSLGINGAAKVWARPGISYTSGKTYSSVGGKTLWTETTFDARRGNRDFSVMMLFDAQSNKKTKLTARSKFFSPAFSPDGKKIVVVETDVSGSGHLLVLDAYAALKVPNGNPNKKKAMTLHTFRAGVLENFAFPQFSADGTKIYSAKQNSEGQQLVEIDPAGGTQTVLLKNASEQFIYLKATEKHLYFTSGLGGVMNVFAYSFADGKTYQATQSRFGAYHPCPDPKEEFLYYSDYTALGFEIRKTKIDPSNWPEADFGKSTVWPAAEKVALHEGFLATEQVGAEKFPVKKYNPWRNVVNLHSWTPLASTTSNTGAQIPEIQKIGFALYSDNLMSTLNAAYVFQYDRFTKNSTQSFQLNYAALFPVISLAYQNELERSLYYFDSQADSVFLNRWNETTAKATLTLPFNLTHGNYFAYAWFKGGFQQASTNYLRGHSEAKIFGGSFQGVEFSADMGNLRRTALQNLKPRWGQQLSLSFRQNLNAGLANSFSAKALAYLPGLKKNHSFYLKAGFQSETFGNSYRYNNRFEFARGYNVSNGAFTPFLYQISEGQSRNRYAGFALNYAFPIFYPDWGLSSLAFLKRLKANLFYDGSYLDVTWQDRSLIAQGGNFKSSAGAELSLDFRAFRLADLDVGIRYAFLFSPDGQSPHQFEFLTLGLGF